MHFTGSTLLEQEPVPHGHIREQVLSVQQEVENTLGGEGYCYLLFPETVPQCGPGNNFAPLLIQMQDRFQICDQGG